MKIKLRYLVILILLCTSPVLNFAQTPDLGTCENFVLFSSNGAVSNTGITHLTGNVGTNNGSSTGFGNVDGGMHDNDLVTAQAATDLLALYADLNSTIPTLFPGAALGNGVTLEEGVYSIPSAATLNLVLTLDGQGDPNALFIFKIDGPLSTTAHSKVELINGAQACNVFWKVEGLVDMSTGTKMCGTIVANNSAIIMNTGDTLQGRALSIAGAVTVDGVFGYTPIGCGSPILTGPTAPSLGSTACYGIFSSDGPVTNSGISFITGDVGTNVGLTTGFDALNVTGSIHPIPDGSTAAAATDLLNSYTTLNTLAADIELLYPAQFGNNLVLTPHTYVMNGAVTFTDNLYLNAQGNANAVFVIQINGAMSTSTFSKVILMNGTQAKNVFWKIDGAVEINDYSMFAGTIIGNNGAIELKTGVIIDGRAMTTTGALNSVAISNSLPAGCATVFNPAIVTQPLTDTACIGEEANFKVLATGTNLTYQWRKGTTNLVDNASVSGSTTANLTINPVSGLDFGTDYNVIVSGDGAPSETSINASLFACVLGLETLGHKQNNMVKVYPNPFMNSIQIVLNDNVESDQLQFTIYSTLGEEVLNAMIITETTFLETSNLPSGIYYYTLTGNNQVFQTGKLVSQK